MSPGLFTSSGMRKFTLWGTLLGIVAGLGIGFERLFHPLFGLVFGLFWISPLFVTLAMSNYLVGTATQTILLGSTIGYVTQLVHQVHFGPSPHIFPSWSHSIPAMIVLWFVAGWLSHDRDEIERRGVRNSSEPGP